MKKTLVAAVILLAVGGAVLAMRRGRAMDTGASSYENDSEQPDYYDPGAQSFIETVKGWTEQNIIEQTYLEYTMAPIPQAGTNIAAMLETIAKSEGTAGRGDPYRVCYAYRHTISSLSDHPAVTGEWRGEALSDAMCSGAGLGPGCVSTAAGKYQIIKPTWLALKRKLNLPDFSPASQDAAAVELLRQRGALVPLEQGRFADAVFAARKEWASLKGAGYGQGERSIEWLTAKFTEAGGVTV